MWNWIKELFMRWKYRNVPGIYVTPVRCREIKIVRILSAGCGEMIEGDHRDTRT